MKLDPYESIGFHCNLTTKTFLSALGEKLQGSGISPGQFLALANLTALGPLSQSEPGGYPSQKPFKTILFSIRFFVDLLDSSVLFDNNNYNKLINKTNKEVPHVKSCRTPKK